MGKPARLETVCTLLAERYSDQGLAAAERLRTWISGKVPIAYPDQLAKHLDPQILPLTFDAFWQVLPFGTGGRRGPVGYGTNRINPSTIVLTVQGHCDYLRATAVSSDVSVVVANDVRIFNDLRGSYRFLGGDHPLIGLSSRQLAKLACEVYSANGIVCYLADPQIDDATLSTPELSFLISELGSAGGINISASHNPPDDNGIKVYDQYGSQPIAPDDQTLIDAMERVTEVSQIPFSEALAQGLVRNISDQHHRSYVDGYVRLFGDLNRGVTRHPIVFTPLCGTGLTTVGRVLPELGFSILVPPEEQPNGAFDPIPFRIPNPEVPEATQPAKKFAMEHHVDVVFSSDPDADRVGVEIRLPDNSWYHFDGNQIASMLCYFLMLDPKGPRKRGLVIETLVTTKMLGRIVQLAGHGSWIVDDLLVGFKYVASVIKEIEQTGEYEGRLCSIGEFVVAAEESHGVVVLPSIRDKDAVGGCIYLGALYELLKNEGRTLLDYYIEILETVGEFAEASRSIVMAGAEGVFRRDEMMASMRQSPPRSFNGQPIRSIKDYWDQDAFGKFVSESDKLPRNVIQYTLDSHIITVRPSGTEPKLKIYCQFLPGQESSPTKGLALMQAARQKSNLMVRGVYGELLQRIGITTGPISLLLPDIIDTARKETFENEIVPQLITVVDSGRFNSSSEVLDWLRSRVEDMLPGTDVLPGLKATISFLCKESFRGCSPELLDELEEWTKS